MNKKLATLFLTVVTALSVMTSSVSAHTPTAQYRWTVPNVSVDQYTGVTSPYGWPFDDGHFVAAFYGDDYSASQWKLKHYHLYFAQDSNQNGDRYQLERLLITNSANGYSWSSSLHAGHGHTALNYTEEITADFYATKNKTKVTFEIKDVMYNTSGYPAATYTGRKWRDNF